MPDYQTIRGISTFEYEEKRSRFMLPLRLPIPRKLPLST